MKRAAVALLALALAGALAADELSPATPKGRPSIRPAGESGALACPIALTGKGPGFIDLANLGDEPSDVRVAVVPDVGKPVAVPVRVPPGSVRSVRMRGRVRSPAGAIVEHSGGEIIASHSVSVSGDAGGRAAAPCPPARGDLSVVLLGATLRAATSLVMMNPGEGDAVVEISFVAGQDVIRPERLRQRVVRARRRLAIRVQDFVFDRRDVAAVVRMRAGRVVSEGMLSAPGGVEILPASEPAPEAAVIAGPRDAGLVGILAPGEDGASVDAQFLSAESGGRAPGVPAEAPSLRGLRLATPATPAGSIAYSLRARDRAPIALATRWRARRPSGTDLVASAGAAPALRWGAVASAPEGEAKVVQVTIANPGSERATVTLRKIGVPGPPAATLVIEPGRVASDILARAPGTYAVEAMSDRAVVVSLSGIGARPGVWAFAMTATPLLEAPRIAVVPDPRGGVPAPR